MELAAIKGQYLGSDKPKKRVMIKRSDKFRFSFDWEKSEDTSQDTNSLYQNPHEALLLFGRGSRAGICHVEEDEEKPVGNKRKEPPSDLRVDQKKLEDMNERNWKIFMEDSRLGSRVPTRPMRNWAESNLSSVPLKSVERVGYSTPSPIQMAAIPLGLQQQQRDVIGIAETASGKTAAFVIPMLAHIARLPPMTEENKAEGPYAVVLAPTRELAQKIKDETLKLAHYMRIKVVSIVDGQSIENQSFRIGQGCKVVIATPGRLLDCLDRRYVVLNQCNYVVLDEADRMTDMNFEEQVVKVLDAMPSS